MTNVTPGVVRHPSPPAWPGLMLGFLAMGFDLRDWF